MKKQITQTIGRGIPYGFLALTLTCTAMVFSSGCRNSDSVIVKKDFREITEYTEQKLKELVEYAQQNNSRQRDFSRYGEDLEETLKKYVDMKRAENFEVWKRAAARGVPEGQILLGRCYLEGIGIHKDEAMGASWIRKAAEKGHPLAQIGLGTLCFSGIGVPKSEAEGAMWIRKAAERGHAEAQMMLAELYLSGTGVPEDKAMAEKWLRNAAKQGLDVAKDMLKAFALAKEDSGNTTTDHESETDVVGRNGKDIYVAIAEANAEREPLGLRNLWPKTEGVPHGERDITNVAFQNSSSYFYALFDGENIGNLREWAPYVQIRGLNSGLYFSKLASPSVPAMTGTGKLRAENNIWCIAANVRDDMSGIIPLLVTRNVDCSSLYKDYNGKANTSIQWSKQYSIPSSKEGFVMIRKDGSMYRGTAKSATARTIYGNQAFRTTVDGKAPLVYLTPDGIAHPR